MTLVCNRPTSELKALVSRLGGTWSGNTAMCLCPAHADRTPSLSIRQGDRAILVTCHAGCDRSDVLRAIGRITRIPHFNPAKIERAPARSGNAFLKIWREGRPIEGSLAECYVRQVRGIGGVLQDLRFHPRCPRGQGALARFEPALLVGMRRDGDLAAIQRIFLDPRTRSSTAKLCLGRAIGSAWTNGIHGNVLGLCEGFETAAAFTALVGIKAWASMGAKRFHQLTIPRQVERLILLADNDAEGHRAAIRALVAYSRPGLAIETRWPPHAANDWADLLKR
ncbi:topoisomerase [Novosphingobium sp. PC22D]|uniref:DUF7146 domain-containing protein n=1 Tax=Novosphingobium sp. PC22D TaxID=1962403 RepID=UPI000BF1BB8A|nr:toprim domain-containing protein [Novosphingobium sp. PC22D]PEQ12542.1 topoisomerase [Novosphingobium sp. PC22D]